MVNLRRDTSHKFSDPVVVTALVGVSLAWLNGVFDNPDDPQGFKCKHGNSPGTCLACWIEKNP